MLYNTNIDKISKEGQKNGPTILDKLAQLPTAPKIEAFKGANSPKNKFNKKAKAKDYTQRINAPLCYLDSPNHKMYSNAYNCNNIQIWNRETQKLTSRYCNSRTCMICNRIRTAKLLNGYFKPLFDLMDNEPDKKLEFVTLTIPNCKKEDLAYTRDKMAKNLTNIIRVLNEKRGMDISGIKKIEITYNDIEDNYHPHFHIIVNKNSGQLIIDEWLKRYTEAEIWCQQTKKVNDIHALKELFKYSTKFLIKDNKTGKQKIYTHAIDVIMSSLYKKRSVQSFGKLKKLDEQISEEIEQLISEEIENMYQLELLNSSNDFELIIWNEEYRNYFTKTTNEQFTFQKPPDENNFDVFY